MKNALLEVVIHKVAIVEDEKIVKSQPIDFVSFDSVSNVRDVSDLFDAADAKTGRDSI